MLKWLGIVKSSWNNLGVKAYYSVCTSPPAGLNALLYTSNSFTSFSTMSPQTSYSIRPSPLCCSSRSYSPGICRLTSVCFRTMKFCSALVSRKLWSRRISNGFVGALIMKCFWSVLVFVFFLFMEDFSWMPWSWKTSWLSTYSFCYF